MNAELFQRTVAVAGNAKHTTEGVIGNAGHAQHGVAGAQHAEQRNGQGVGAADKVVTHQGILCAQCLGKHFVQGISSTIAVAVTGGRNKVAFADARFVKSCQHFLLIVLGGFVNFSECLLQRGQHRFRCGTNRFVNVKIWINQVVAPCKL